MKETTVESFIIADCSDERDIKYIIAEQDHYYPVNIDVWYSKDFSTASHYPIFSQAQSHMYDIMGVGQYSELFNFEIDHNIKLKHLKIVKCTTKLEEV